MFFSIFLLFFFLISVVLLFVFVALVDCLLLFVAEYVYAGHRNDTFFVRCAVSPDGSYLLSGSGKNTGVIWQVGY